MKITKIAFTTDQNRTKINQNDSEIKKLKKSIKDLERDLKSATKIIESLNIGARRFWQQSSVFTSIQRKLERFEKIEVEWNKYKKEMDYKVKKLIERSPRASIQPKT